MVIIVVDAVLEMDDIERFKMARDKFTTKA